MSLKPKPARPMTDELLQIRGCMKESSVYRLVGDRLYERYNEADYVDLYSPEGRPGLSPVDLSFITAFQFLEKLSDREAADAVRTRIDWKYALHLPLNYAGFDASVLCEFRARIVRHGAQERLFNAILEDLNALGLLKRRGRQRSDSLAILTKVRHLNRLERVVETLRLALRALWAVDLAWVQHHVPASWQDLYGERCVAERLTEAQRHDIEARVGLDGQWLLDRLQEETTPPSLRALPEVQILGTVWSQQFEVVAGCVVFQEAGSYDGKTRIQTPHDPEARYSKKGKQQWVGDKLQVTETDDEGLPHLITDIDVTSSVETDYEALDAIQQRLVDRDLAPSQHCTDGGYVDAGNLASSAARGIDLFGPVQGDRSPQARWPEGITLTQFQLDREAQTVTCPGGQTVGVRLQADQRLTGRFATSTCAACELRPKCCAGRGGRGVSFGGDYDVLQAARDRQKTEAFKNEYRQHRGGVEGCLSGLVRGQGIRVARYTARAKRRLHAQFTAAAVNLRRAARWLAGMRPPAKRQGLRWAPAA